MTNDLLRHSSHFAVNVMHAICLYCSLYSLFVGIFAVPYILNICLHHILYTHITIFVVVNHVY